jgi:hypothetical protein
MAIPPEKRKLLFVKGRPSEEELNERFFKRVSYPVLRPADQEALAFNKNNELLDLIRGSKAQDKNLKADIEKRLRRALLDKEIAMDNLAQARYDNNEDLEEFYLKNIQILDDTINNTRKEYERVNLSTKYLDDLKPIKYESLTGGRRTPERRQLFPAEEVEQEREEPEPEPEPVRERRDYERYTMRDVLARVAQVKREMKGTPNSREKIRLVNRYEKILPNKHAFISFIRENERD